MFITDLNKWALGDVQYIISVKSPSICENACLPLTSTENFSGLGAHGSSIV